MNPSNSPRPRDQDVRLSVPPDLPDDSLPLLQASGLLQLLGWGKHVHAPQSTVGLAATIAHGPHRHFRHLLLLIILLRDALVLLILFAGLFQLSPLGGWRRFFTAAAAGPAGDAGHHEAQRHQQAETDTHHEIEGEALWVGCLGRKTQKLMMTRLKKFLRLTYFTLESLLWSLRIIYRISDFYFSPWTQVELSNTN